MSDGWASREATWTPELAPGIKLLIRPPTGEERAVALAKAGDLVGNLRRGLAGLEALGIDGFELNAPGGKPDMDQLRGVMLLATACYLAADVIEDWTGVDNAETGAPIPLADAAVFKLLRLGPPEGGMPLFELFTAWIDRHHTPVAADCARLRELAAWEHGGGGKHCDTCVMAEQGCAKGGVNDSGATCPRDRCQPQTAPGVAAWKVTQSPGLWKVAGIAGTVTGLDYSAAMALADAEGCFEPAALIRCMSAIESGALEGLRQKARPLEE